MISVLPRASEASRRRVSINSARARSALPRAQRLPSGRLGKQQARLDGLADQRFLIRAGADFHVIMGSTAQLGVKCTVV